MKMLVLMFMLLSPSAAYCAEKIHSASNLEGGKVALELSAKERRLMLLNLSSGVKEPLPWPPTEEEVMGTLLLPDRLLLISQFTAGGGKPARLHELEFRSKRWSAAKEISCLSFDQVSLKGNELKVQCEAEPGKEVKAREVALRIEGKAKKELKLELPVSADSQEKFSFRLTGPLMAWDALEVKTPTGQKKSFQAEKLANDAK